MMFHKMLWHHIVAIHGDYVWAHIFRMLRACQFFWRGLDVGPGRMSTCADFLFAEGGDVKAALRPCLRPGQGVKQIHVEHSAADWLQAWDGVPFGIKTVVSVPSLALLFLAIAWIHALIVV